MLLRVYFVHDFRLLWATSLPVFTLIEVSMKYQKKILIKSGRFNMMKLDC